MNFNAEIAIIGGGPAGATCAIQLKREGLCPTLFEKERIGGTLHWANSIDNLPFVPAGTSGAALAKKIAVNLSHFDINAINAEIVKIEKTVEDRFKLHSAAGAEFSSDFVVLACGLAHKSLELPAWLETFRRDGPNIAQDDGAVLLIGGGDVALDRAISWKLQSPERQVCVLNRSGKWKALAALHKRAEKTGVVCQTGSIDDLVPSGDGFTIRGRDTVFHHLALHIGRTQSLPQIAIHGENITPLVINDCGETQINGLFLAGDARRVSVRHAAIAAADGLLAALEISKRIR